MQSPGVAELLLVLSGTFRLRTHLAGVPTYSLNLLPEVP